MARHLLIGNDVARNYTANVLDSGAIDVQKLSSAGPTSLVGGEGIADSDQIRIVQGTGAASIVSPWIYGRDIVAFGGQSGAAQTAEVKNIALATNATAAGFHTIKLINITNGEAPFQFKSYEIEVAAGATPTTQCTAFAAAINADLPDFVSSITNNGTDIDFTGFKKGQVKADGSIANELTAIEIVFETVTGGAEGDNGTTATITDTTPGSRGSGDGFYIREMEEELRGTTYGFYNRLQQPNTPAATSVTATAYDMYHIVATKDGSSSSQIHGVDNLIEIYIAFDPTTAARTQLLESQLNGYLGSVNFPPVNL